MDQSVRIALLKAISYGLIIIMMGSFMSGCQHPFPSKESDCIRAEQLKNLIDTRIPMTIIDARNPAWDDGHRIPGAKFISHDTSIAIIEKILPAKENLIVVYCGSYECPASKMLGQKLIDNGYQHVLEYSGGIKEWEEKHYPIEMGQKMKRQ